MKPIHRRVHVVLWALVAIATIATILTATLTRPVTPMPGPGIPQESTP